jgi:hypothetical protein
MTAPSPVPAIARGRSSATTNSQRAGSRRALRARFNEMLAQHPSLNRELAERLSGVDLTHTSRHRLRIRWWGATRPAWRGVRAVLLRPDGHIGWVVPDASAESAASLLRALAGWLDAAVGGVSRSTHRYP